MDLQAKILLLEEEISYLKKLLDDNRIKYAFREMPPTPKHNDTRIIEFPEITPDYAKFFYSMFKGRKDVFSHRVKLKNGNTAYIPECANRWKPGICPKSSRTKIKCSDCNNKAYVPLSQRELIKHLQGLREDCGDVIGIYPLLPDNTCNFIVYDFDNHDDSETLDWQSEVNSVRMICEKNGVDALVERSRSGKGAHIWIFFSEPVTASVARKFGAALITKGMESVSLKNFNSYDRMMPMQDSLDEGKLGNLIALPLQGRALKEGNSAFVDNNWEAYPDQWGKLKEIKKISKNFITSKIEEWCPNGQYQGILQSNTSDDSLPWEHSANTLSQDDANGIVHIILSNGIYIDKTNIRTRLQNRIRRLAAYSNPEFYKNLHIGFSTKGIPSIVYCGYDTDNYIVIPRGCLDSLCEMLNSALIPFEIDDKRHQGNHIDVSFKGNLYPEQTNAVNEISSYDTGVLSAATAFGKTVVGAYLISKIKVNALVLVRNTEILRNWIDDLGKFLQINEELPTYKTTTGRIRKRKSLIGTISSGKNTLTGIVDIAMITSLGKGEDLLPDVKNYGMVIVDECHHAAAATDEDVLRTITAKYVYGMTATPKRDDGQTRKIFMQLGPIRFRYTAKDRAQKQGIGHFVYPRFTRLVNLETEQQHISELYKLVIGSEIRNSQIVKDVRHCISLGRTPLVITKQKGHASILYNLLQDSSSHIFLLQGGRSSKERDKLRQEMNAVPDTESIILVAIDKYIGEGFNYPRLDTLFITMPMAWEGNIEQYAGRLNRDYEGKKDVIIYDYIDYHIRKFSNMYAKRLCAYKKIGFEICSEVKDRQMITQSLFDWQSYASIYQKDLESATSEIIISGPAISNAKSWALITLNMRLSETGVRIIVSTLSPGSFEDGKHQAEVVQALRESGITVITTSNRHERFAVIDKNIVWYGSINLLSIEKHEDSLMRIESKEIAAELLEAIVHKT